MKALIVIGCILLILFLIGRIRVGALVRYSDAGAYAAVALGPLRIRLIPAKRTGKKKEPAKKTRKSKPKKAGSGRKTKDTLVLVKQFIPLLGEAAGGLKRKIRIDRIALHVIWGAGNPAAAALGFGAGNAVLGILWPCIEHNFNVKTHDLGVDVDFERKKPTVEVEAQATLTVGQGLALGIKLGVKVLKIFLGVRREQNEQKAVQQ